MQDGPAQAVITECPPPIARTSASLVPHPLKDELIMFGGELFDGKFMKMFDDLLFYKYFLCAP